MGAVKDLLMENLALKLEIKDLKTKLLKIQKAYIELLKEDTSLKF